jgi:hypothetical protein
MNGQVLVRQDGSRWAWAFLVWDSPDDWRARPEYREIGSGTEDTREAAQQAGEAFGLARNFG